MWEIIFFYTLNPKKLKVLKTLNINKQILKYLITLLFNEMKYGNRIKIHSQDDTYL